MPAAPCLAGVPSPSPCTPQGQFPTRSPMPCPDTAPSPGGVKGRGWGSAPWGHKGEPLLGTWGIWLGSQGLATPSRHCSPLAEQTAQRPTDSSSQPQTCPGLGAKADALPARRDPVPLRLLACLTDLLIYLFYCSASLFFPSYCSLFSLLSFWSFFFFMSCAALLGKAL